MKSRKNEGEVIMVISNVLSSAQARKSVMWDRLAPAKSHVPDCDAVFLLFCARHALHAQ